MTGHIRRNPPFRAEQLGSLKRPSELLEARVAFDQGKITSDELHNVEDKHIAEIVEMQRSVGIKGVTDGEFRRSANSTRSKSVIITLALDTCSMTVYSTTSRAWSM